MIAAAAKAAGLALERGLLLCEQGDSARGLLWLARSLHLTPPEAADLDRAVRFNIDGWSRHMPLLRSVVGIEGSIAAETFSPDGRTILLIGTDGVARRFDPDGQTVRTASGRRETLDVEVRSARVPVPKEGDREQVRSWCEVVTGLQLDEADGVRVLDSEAWRDRRQRLPDRDPIAR